MVELITPQWTAFPTPPV